jgi:uncharacterized protein YhbP (UPF0306 family)
MKEEFWKRNAFFFIHSLGFIYDEVLLCRQHFIFQTLERRFIYFPSESTVHWKKENHSPPILHPIERNPKMGGPFKGVRNEEEPRGSG